LRPWLSAAASSFRPASSSALDRMLADVVASRLKLDITSEASSACWASLREGGAGPTARVLLLRFALAPGPLPLLLGAASHTEELPLKLRPSAIPNRGPIPGKIKAPDAIDRRVDNGRSLKS
jgi:hypothetical protein